MTADYVDNFVEFIEKKQWKLALYCCLPFLYLFPWLTLTSIACYFAFLLGMVVKESIIDEKGGLGLVERHFQERIGTKYESARDFTKELPVVQQQLIEITPELDGAIDKLINFIVRDFVQGWYENLNKSQSSEFPDAIKATLKQVFISLGKSGSGVNPTELMLSVMRQLILHVKEFREFDLTGLDIKDYLKANPDSKFHRFYTRKQVIEHLRNLSMKLCIHLLPRADRNSAAVFGITREILATTVLLPVLDKITCSDFINSAVLNALKKQKSDGADTPEIVQEESEIVKDEYLDRSLQLANLIKQKEDRINFLDSNLATVHADDISQNLEEKLKNQGQLQELLEFQSQEQDSPCLEKLLDISKAVVFVQVESENTENNNSILNGFGLSGNSVASFDIRVTTAEGKSWTIIKTLKDIDTMYKALVEELPRLRNNPVPKFIGEVASTFSSFEKKITEDELQDRATELMIFFTFLLKDHVAPFCLSLVKFFQPAVPKEEKVGVEMSLSGSVNYLLKMGAGANNDMQKALSNAGNSTLALMKKASIDNIAIQTELDGGEDEVIDEHGSISQQDLDMILDVAFTAIEELFFLAEGDQWLRQQSLHFIKVILKRTFSKRLSRFLASKVSAVSSQPMATETLGTLSDKLWPDGRRWGSGEPPEVKSQHDIDRTTHQLYCLLLGKDEVKKSKEFEGVYSNIQTALGVENAKKGLIRGFHLIQQQQLTAGFACEVLEVVVSMITEQL